MGVTKKPQLWITGASNCLSMQIRFARDEMVADNTFGASPLAYNLYYP